MIKYNTIRDIDDKTPEGKLVIAALAMLTTETYRDDHPDTALSKVVDLANKIYYEDQYKQYEKEQKLLAKLNSVIINEKLQIR